MSDKLQLPKRTKKITLVDLSFDYPDEFYVEVWDDPSKSLVFDLFSLVFATTEELNENKKEAEEMYDKFISAISKIFVSTNIDGIDLSTKDSVEKSMNCEDLPWGFLYEICWRYVAHLLQTNEKLKKVFRLQDAISNSGQEEKEAEQK